MLKKLNFALAVASYLYVGYILVDGLIHIGEEVVDHIRARKVKTEEKRIETEFDEIVKSI